MAYVTLEGSVQVQVEEKTAMAGIVGIKPARAVGTRDQRADRCRISITFEDSIFEDIAKKAEERGWSFAAMARSLIRAGLRAQ